MIKCLQHIYVASIFFENGLELIQICIHCKFKYGVIAITKVASLSIPLDEYIFCTDQMYEKEHFLDWNMGQ